MEIKHQDIDFKSTKAYPLIKNFIFTIDNNIKNKPQHPYPSGFILDEIKRIIEGTELSTVKGRYTNPAMVKVLTEIETLTDSIYLRNSFGNKIRMDFGTGHELNFLCYLYTLVEDGKIEIQQVSGILVEYFRIVRLFVSKFNVEAAGSRGCWSIDDYLLLPYLFGSSEYFHSNIPVDLVEKGMFREASVNNHSAMLKSIMACSWQKINLGMIKMYDDEVFGQHVVTQHFIFSDFLPV